jgi:hypothetical protein
VGSAADLIKVEARASWLARIVTRTGLTCRMEYVRESFPSIYRILLFGKGGVIPRRPNFMCRRFGILCLFHLHRCWIVYIERGRTLGVEGAPGFACYQEIKET